MDRIEGAFSKYSRQDFVPDDLRGVADIDTALPIGFGQTISQPTTVEMMLEWLEAEPGNKVLDVGSGSGWTTALLSHIVGPNGKIYAVEIVPELVEFGRDNAHNAGVKNAKFFQAGQKLGLPQYAPYDRILVSASAKEVPKELLAQLKVGGKMVIPINYNILEIQKLSETDTEITQHPSFIFVPLIQDSAN